jgi:hypothetical protein
MGTLSALAIASMALVTGLLITPVNASTSKLPAMLLSISQMPTGWAMYSGSSNGLGCLANVLEPKGIKQTASASVEFEDNGSLPAIVERLVIFRNAKVGYQKIVSHLQSCNHLSGTTSGQKFSGTVGQASFPHYGNASAAFEATFTLQGESLGEDLLIVRMGNIVMGIDEGDLAPVDTGQFQGFVNKALAKLPTASKVATTTTKTTTAPKPKGVYPMGTAVSVPVTIDGINSATVFAFYANQSTNQPDVDTPPNGDTYGVVDAQECAGAGGSNTGADETDFTVLLSNGSTARQDFVVGQFTTAPLSSESGLGSSASGLSVGQCDRGWIVFDIPTGVTPQYVQFTGTTASFSAANSVVKWPIPSS